MVRLFFPTLAAQGWGTRSLWAGRGMQKQILTLNVVDGQAILDGDNASCSVNSYWIVYKCSGIVVAG